MSDPSEEIEKMLRQIEAGDFAAFQRSMIECRERHHALRLIDGIVSPLMKKVGDYWYENRINVYQEHVVSECVRSLMASYPPYDDDEGEVVLLANPAGENHSLGLIVLAYALRLAQANCINVGANLPLDELIKAVDSFNPRILCLSFSACSDPRYSEQYLAAAVSGVPETTAVWIGGTGVPLMEEIPAGVAVFSTASEAYSALIKSRI